MIAVGNDISKKTIDIQILDNNQTYIKISNDEQGFERLLKKMPEKPETYHLCIEATGNYYENFADFMVTRGYHVTVVNPLKISYFAKSEFQKTKTDKQDCKLIAQYCQEKLLNKKGTYKVPTEKQYQVKRILNYIRQMKIDKTALQNRKNSAKDDFIVSELQRQIDELQAHIQTAMEKVAELTKCEAKEILKSIPSVSETTAQILIHFLTMFDFKTVNQFVSFAGLSPQQSKSGTSVNKKERLSKYGNRLLKSALYMPAVVAYRMGVFRQLADSMEKRGKNKKMVIVAIMRKLAALAFTLYTKGEFYRLKEA